MVKTHQLRKIKHDVATRVVDLGFAWISIILGSWISIRIRIRSGVKSWIWIRFKSQNSEALDAQNRAMEELSNHSSQIRIALMRSRIRIRIKVRSRIRARFRVKRGIRIRIKVMRDPPRWLQPISMEGISLIYLSFPPSHLAPVSSRLFG